MKQLWATIQYKYKNESPLWSESLWSRFPHITKSISPHLRKTIYCSLSAFCMFLEAFFWPQWVCSRGKRGLVFQQLSKSERIHVLTATEKQIILSLWIKLNTSFVLKYIKFMWFFLATRFKISLIYYECFLNKEFFAVLVFSSKFENFWWWITLSKKSFLKNLKTCCYLLRCCTLVKFTKSQTQIKIWDSDL